MGATSVTGKGIGASNKVTTKELSALANGPDILVAGRFEAGPTSSSPPSSTGIVRFQEPLPGDADNYVVILTGIGNTPYVAAFLEDGGNFTGFLGVAEDDGEVMYSGTKAGQKPTI